jgi:hypothetical protein
MSTFLLFLVQLLLGSFNKLAKSIILVDQTLVLPWSMTILGSFLFQMWWLKPFIVFLYSMGRGGGDAESVSHSFHHGIE